MTAYATLARPAPAAVKVCTRCGIDGLPLHMGRCRDCRQVECPRGHLRPEDPPLDRRGQPRCQECERANNRSYRRRKDQP